MYLIFGITTISNSGHVSDLWHRTEVVRKDASQKTCMAENYPGQCGDKAEKKNVCRPRPPFSYFGAASSLDWLLLEKLEQTKPNGRRRSYIHKTKQLFKDNTDS